jgi:hypothetical protein
MDPIDDSSPGNMALTTNTTNAIQATEEQPESTVDASPPPTSNSNASNNLNNDAPSTPPASTTPRRWRNTRPQSPDSVALTTDATTTSQDYYFVADLGESMIAPDFQQEPPGLSYHYLPLFVFDNAGGHRNSS